MAYRSKPPPPKQKKESIWPSSILYEGLGIVWIAVAIFLLLTLLSFHPDDPSFNQTGGEAIRNAAGLFGAYLSDALLQTLGYSAGGLVVLFGLAGMQLFRHSAISYWDRMVSLVVLIVATAILSALLWDKGVLPAGPGGVLGSLGAERVRRALGPMGALILLVPIVVVCLMVLIRFSLIAYWRAGVAFGQRLFLSPDRPDQPPVGGVEPRIPAEIRAEEKKRAEADVEAKRRATAEANRRADLTAKERAHRQQIETEAGMKREMISTAQVTIDPLEKEVRAERETLGGRLGRLCGTGMAHTMTGMRQGSTVLLRWLRRGVSLGWQQMEQARRAARFLAKRPLGNEAEPEFFPAQSEGGREPTFEDVPAAEPPPAVRVRDGQGEPERVVEPVVPARLVPSVAPVAPVVSVPQPEPPAERLAWATPIPTAPVREACAAQRPEPAQRVEPAQRTETPLRNPYALVPESAGQLAASRTETVVVSPVVALTPARDLPSFEAFPQPSEDRQDLMRGLERVWQDEPLEEASGLPPFSLMVDPGPKKLGGPTREDLNLIARMLEQKLADFKIKGQIVDVLPGPVVTTFELDPAPGLRAAKVIGLADDLARSISVSSVRVVGNVPGKTVIGIEIPNEVRQTVYLKEILTSEAFRKVGSPLAVALGSDIFGNPVAGNLAKMPHLLVAGTTGSGKSVAVNAMICSILFSATPKEVRFLMVDPKMLELSIYEGIPHLLAPVVTDVHKAANLLKWAVTEMENRYRLMSELGVRNLTGFNERINECIENDEQPTRRVKLGTDPETGRSVEQEEPIPLDTKPLIVIVIDELADLMIQVGKEVEPAIARLAQMARAAGLHLILATQRPSVDVITGLIKANFPTRLAFQVSSKIDSRTILDAMGADRLLGMGDGLFLPPGTSHLQRIHAPFVSDKEVHDLVRYLRSTGTPDYDLSVLVQRDSDEGDEGGFLGGAGGEEQDELYDQAVRIVLKERKVSTSLVQRIFKIGYNRAARIVEQMEAEGLVSAPNGAGKREVLAPEG
ncbi:MAG: DNA translocase FtsK 4TM domain-containing protein [Magnetococcales bacterium]|nr:DNA translocase FtsK 4TM domain-containing protein [Magnetococcales bacterium]